MRKSLYAFLFVVLSGSLAAQTNTRWNRSKIVFEAQPASIRLAPHVTTTIRVPEPINSVVVGDSNLFQAEYSPNEPLLVFAKPLTLNVAQTNFVISTVRGRQFILVAKTVGVGGDETEALADLLVICQPSGLRFIDESLPSAVVSETVGFGIATAANAALPEHSIGLSLDEIINRQRHENIASLHGDRMRIGIGRVVENGSRLIVPFSVINSNQEAIELVTPQIQLAGQTNSGIFRRSRWITVQQIPIEDFQLTERRLNPGVRADGVVVFERPAIKQSSEGLFLQIADSAAIDQPVLAPINFRQKQ